MQCFWSWLSSLPTSPLFSVASFVLAVLGVILTVYFYRKGQRCKELSYVIQSDTLVEDLSDRFPKLKISFADEDISVLTVSRVAVWNSGTESIRGTDISKNDPLRIELLGGSRLLNAEITSRTRVANAFTIRHGDQGNAVSFSFDYVDSADGIVVSLIHSGSKQDVRFEGSIIGVRRLIHRTASLSLKSLSLQRDFPFKGIYLSLFMGVFGAALIALAVWSYTLPAKVLIAVFGGIYVLCSFLLLERDTLPKELQILDKDKHDTAPNKTDAGDA